MVKKSTAATLEAAPPVELIDDPAAVLRERAQTRFADALKVYRDAVDVAIANGGRLPESMLDTVSNACTATGIPVEQFADDVVSVQRFRKYEGIRDDLQANQASYMQEIRATASEVDRLQKELTAAKEAHRRISGRYDSRLVNAIREVNQLRSQCPHLFDASVTLETVKRKLTTRAYFTND
jgi:hypothetical protein